MKNKTSQDDQMGVVAVDFSENYTSKHNTTVQSSYFSASHIQICLHTGILCIKSKPISFRSISESTLYSPAAIWAHLMPLFKYSKNNHPALKYLNFWSDALKCNIATNILSLHHTWFIIMTLQVANRIFLKRALKDFR